MYDYERGYINYGIYNCKSGAYIANNSICIYVINIISEDKRKNYNIDV